MFHEFEASKADCQLTKNSNPLCLEEGVQILYENEEQIYKEAR